MKICEIKKAIGKINAPVIGVPWACQSLIVITMENKLFAKILRPEGRSLPVDEL